MASPLSISKLIVDCVREVGNAEFSDIDGICSGMLSAQGWHKKHFSVQSLSFLALARGPIWHGMVRKIIVEAARAKWSTEQLKTQLISANAPFAQELSDAYEVIMRTDIRPF